MSTFKDLRVEELYFTPGLSGVSLLADGNGTFTFYSAQPINATLQSVILGSNTYTSTGSLMLFESGISPILLASLRVGSITQVQTFPAVYGAYYNGNYASGTTGAWLFQEDILGTLAISGAGLGASTSGLNLKIRYY